MTETCQNCSGRGYIQTSEDKLVDVMRDLYNTITIKKNTHRDNDYVIYVSDHTPRNGGTNGDIITYREIDRFNKLGYHIGSVSKEYIYVLKNT